MIRISQNSFSSHRSCFPPKVFKVKLFALWGLTFHKNSFMVQGPRNKYMSVVQVSWIRLYDNLLLWANFHHKILKIESSCPLLIATGTRQEPWSFKKPSSFQNLNSIWRNANSEWRLSGNFRYRKFFFV